MKTGRQEGPGQEDRKVRKSLGGQEEEVPVPTACAAAYSRLSINGIHVRKGIHIGSALKALPQ
jgi:hypothetical protein